MVSSIVANTLQEIAELGYVLIQEGQLRSAIKPLSNLYTENRWDPTIQFLKDYSRYHEDFGGEYYVCIYDGWREYTQPIDEANRLYLPWTSLRKDEKDQYITEGSKGEQRFSHRHALNQSVYPALPLKVIAYNRHKGDKNVLLIPDYEFIIHQFSQFMRYAIGHDIPFLEKAAKLFWRGTAHPMMADYAVSLEGDRVHEQNVQNIDQRRLLVYLSSGQIVSQPNIQPLLNVSFERTPLEESFQYRYLLDIDGYVSAWSGFFWKLYSNSVVIKAPSLWYVR